MDVVKNSYYVDKTLLIRDLIDDQVPVILFTRPRRFGKTLALDMLKTFLKKQKRILPFTSKISRFGHAVKNIRRCKVHFR